MEPPCLARHLLSSCRLSSWIYLLQAFDEESTQLSCTIAIHPIQSTTFHTTHTPYHSNRAHDNHLGLELWRVLETDPGKIVLGPLIRAGRISKIHKGRRDNKVVAVKIFDDTSTQHSAAMREIRTLFELRHPNIIGFIGWFRSPRPGLLMEYAEKGSLKEVYRRDSMRLPGYLDAMRGAAKGLAYMHCRPDPLVHRHVTSSSILVMQDGTGKIADCAKSRRLNSLTQNTGTSSANEYYTMLWAAPELIRAEQYDETVDCYSLGIILIEVASQKLPYHNEHKGSMKNVNVKMIGSISNGETRPCSQIEEHWPEDFVKVGVEEQDQTSLGAGGITFYHHREAAVDRSSRDHRTRSHLFTLILSIFLAYSRLYSDRPG